LSDHAIGRTEHHLAVVDNADNPAHLEARQLLARHADLT
jgi:hypothetical protein